MTYQLATPEQIAGYLAAVDAKTATLPKEKATIFLKTSSDIVNRYLGSNVSGEERLQLEYIADQIGNRFFRLVGWME